MNKMEKRDKKLRKAIEAGARMVEMSISKIAWDKGHDKIKVVSGKLDYRAHQILDCVADKIATKHWFGQVLGFKDSACAKEPDRYLVIVHARDFKNFIGGKKSKELSNKYLIKIFKEVPKIVLDGATKIPFPISKNKWLDIHFYEDNICGIALAYEGGEFEEYRSNHKQRGRGAKFEEPVFIFLFSNPYGLAFFRSAMNRAGGQPLDPALYNLSPKAQELFQSIRWKRDLIILNPERISKTVDWKWPVVGETHLYRRVNKCRELLNILYENNFINKVTERGKTIERKDWIFYTRKRKLIKNAGKIN